MKKLFKDLHHWVCEVCGVDNRDCRCGNIQY